MAIWKQHADLATINAWSTRTLMQAIDIRVTEIGEDYIKGTMPVDDRTRQPYGILHLTFTQIRSGWTRGDVSQGAADGPSGGTSR